MEYLKSVLNIILFVIIGGLSGYIGGLTSNKIVSFEFNESAIQPTSEQPRRPTIIQEGLAGLSREVASSVVTLSTLGSSRGGPIETHQLLTDSRVISYGVFVTGDGWIVIARPSVPTSQLRVTLEDGSAASIEGRIDDEALPISFIKVDRTVQRAVRFIDSESANEELRVYAVKPQGVFEELIVGRLAYPSSSAINDEIRTTLLLEKRRFLSFKLDQSVPLFDSSGSFVGLSGTEGVIDGSAIHDAVRILLASSVIKRSRVDIRYIDLAHSVYQEGVPLYREGALIGIANQRSLKTEQGDMALHEGDRITHLNGDQINRNSSLSELISEYAVGTVVTLRILTRDGEEKMARIRI